MAWQKPALSTFRHWLRSLFHRERAEHELDSEVRYHLERQIEAKRAAGMSVEDARLATLREFGSVSLAKEESRDARGTLFLENTWKDFRYGLRTLRKNPGFTCVAVLTLALGIGANTAIFSVVNAVLLRPLPFPQSNRLVMVWATNDSGSREDVASYPDFSDWKEQSRSFEGIAAFTNRTMTISDGNAAVLVRGIRPTPGFFELLGAQPEIGRTFRNEESDAGSAHVALLSDAFWKSQFAGRRDILGQTLNINMSRSDDANTAYTVIGVMPPDFKVSPDAQEQIYVPQVRDPDRGHGFLYVLGRLKPGVSIAQAQSEMDAVTHHLAEQYPKFDKGVGTNIVPLVDGLVGNMRPGLLIFLGVVALVLLIACTNVANLMLARGSARQKEIALRAALGAGRARLVRQLLMESTVLALAGGALGLILASWTVNFLVRVLTKNFQIPRIANTHTDVQVLAFTIALSLLTGIVFGLAPALASSKPDLNENLRESSRSASGSTRGRRVRSALVITETVLALILLASAGLLLKTLLVMRSAAPGFQTSNLLTADIFLPQPEFTSNIPRMAFFRNALDRVRAVPGIRSAALVADLPLGGGSDGMGFHIVGRPDPAPGVEFDASFNLVSADYFRTMAIPVREGREFTQQDSTNTPIVVVINETAARQFWPGESPMGKQISMPLTDKTPQIITVIGVTGDVRQRSLGTASRPEMFLDYMQPSPGWPEAVLVARTAGDPMLLAGTVKTMIASVNHDVAVTVVRTMDDVLSASIAQPQVYALLLGVFAGLALALAAIGLYGVISYGVTQRTHEMGIRMALGAGRGDVLRLILRQGLALAVSGVVIGLACTLAVSQLLTHLVGSVQPHDPLTLIAVSSLLMGVALAASYIPASRATRVDPVTALRHE
jgi:putative ABC transport system permease protein